MTELDEQRTERLARLRERRADTPAADGAPLPANPIDPTSLANAPSSVSPSDPSATSEIPAAQTGVGRSRRRPSPAATAKIVTVGASTTAVLGLVATYGLADRVPSANQVTAPGAAIAESTDGSVSAPEPAATIPSPDAQASVTPPPQIIVVVIDGTTGRPITTVDASALDEALTDRASTEPAPVSTEAAPVATSAPTPQPPAPPVAIDLAVPAPPSPAPAPAAPAPAPAPVQATTSGS